MEKRQVVSDLLIIGGGTAGCYAAYTAGRAAPEISITIAEKANIQRSGCLAAGVNALNAYITKGRTPQSYVDYARRDAGGIVRGDLLLTMSERLNDVAAELERLGLVILKDENGDYAARGDRNIKINGENIKPILASAALSLPNVRIVNHVNITDLMTEDGRVTGAAGFDVNDGAAYLFSARAVLIATGGAAGLYRPNNPGHSRHTLWYPPFNTGAGYAMGIRAGAELTTLEMRFIALRCKDTIAPTGTIAQGVRAKQVNSLGEVYETRYGVTTQARVYGTTRENLEGRGPCYLQTEGITPEQDADLLKAYLNMAPSQTLKWVEGGQLPSRQNVEIEGTEPYIVGGHTASGFWVDTRRRTTVPGLYAAGDAAGGAPQKYVTGALAEGEIAAQAMLDDLPGLESPRLSLEDDRFLSVLRRYEAHLAAQPGIYGADELEEAMQKVMDQYAGGIGAHYRYSRAGLKLAQSRIEALEALAERLSAADADDLLRVCELKDRLTVCKSLIAHMNARKETRWPGFGEFTDYPERSASWDGYVNSRLRDGRIEIIRRPLVSEDTSYEHTH